MYKLRTLRPASRLREDDSFYGQNRKTGVGVRKGWRNVFVGLFKIAVILVVTRALPWQFSNLKSDVRFWYANS